LVAWWVIGVVFATLRWGWIGFLVTTLGFPFGWLAAVWGAIALSPWLFAILGVGILSGIGLEFSDRRSDPA
jgi:hypothetical protein